MLMDLQNLYSDAQALTTSAFSTNIIDHGATHHLGGGSPVFILVQVVTTFAGGTSIKADLQVDTDSGFATVVTVQGQLIATASLVAGALFGLGVLPFIGKRYRYSRINYTIVGTYTSGAITAGLVDQQQYYQL